VKFANYVYTSPLYQKKYSALGIEVTVKSGKTAGMGTGQKPLGCTTYHLDTLTVALIIMATGGYVKKVRWAYLLY
jgi:hypothetical protein